MKEEPSSSTTQGTLVAFLDRKCQQYLRLFLPLTSAIFVICMVWTCLIGFFFPDIWWQISEGLLILKTGSFPMEPFRSFGVPNSPFPHEYIAYEVVLASMYSLGGMPLLRFLFIFLGLAPYLMALYCVWKQRAWHPAILYFFGFALFCFFGRMQQRPELVTNSLFVALGWFLLQGTGRHLAWQFIVPFIIMLVWANIHSSFILGWVLVGAYWMVRWGDCLLGGVPALLNRLKEDWRSWAVHSTALVLGTVCTPHGIHRFIDPFLLQSATWSKLASTEMHPPYPVLMIVLVFGVGLMIVCLLAGWLKKENLWIIFVAVLVLALSILSRRYLNVLACTFLVGVIAIVISSPTNRNGYSLLHFPVIVLIVLPFMMATAISQFGSIRGSFTFSSVPGAYPRATFAFLSQQHGDSKIPFLSDCLSSSLGPALYPRLNGFVDTGFNRYTQDSIRYYTLISQSPEALRTALGLLQVEHVVAGYASQHWTFPLMTHPDWSISHIASDGALYSRKGSTPTPTATVPRSVLMPHLRHLANPANLAIANLSSTPPTFWINNFSPPFIFDWIQTIDESTARNFLENFNPNSDALHLAIFMAYRVQDYDLALRLLDQAQSHWLHDIPPLVRAKILLAQNKKDEALKTLAPFRFQRSVYLWYNQLLSELPNTNVPRDLYWNADTEQWFRKYSLKINHRLQHLKSSPVAHPEVKIEFGDDAFPPP